jgi:hypothetical protein
LLKLEVTKMASNSSIFLGILSIHRRRPAIIS